MSKRARALDPCACTRTRVYARVRAVTFARRILPTRFSSPSHRERTWKNGTTERDSRSIHIGRYVGVGNICERISSFDSLWQWFLTFLKSGNTFDYVYEKFAEYQN